MSSGDKYAEFIYRVATTKNKFKIIVTPIGIIFWLGLGVLFVFASLWLDKLLLLHLFLPILARIILSVPLLIAGSVLVFVTVYAFLKARGSPVPLNPPQRLVTNGLYARIRNPMLLGWFLMLFGVGILLSSISLTGFFLPVFILLNILYLKTVEEKEMVKKFGKQYLEYKESVPMFIPRFGRRK